MGFPSLIRAKSSLFLISLFFFFISTVPVLAISYTYDLNDLEKQYETKVIDYDFTTDRSYGYSASQQWIDFGKSVLVSKLIFEYSGSIINLPTYYDSEGNEYSNDQIHYFSGINFNPSPPPSWSGTWSLGSWSNHSYSNEYEESVGIITDSDFSRLYSIDYSVLGAERATDQMGVYLDFFTDFNTTDNIASLGHYNVTDVSLTVISSTPEPVPEPSTILLLSSGLLGLGWYGRKRKKI